MLKPYIGARVTITDGSSAGHFGRVVVIKPTCISIIREPDGLEVDVSNYIVHERDTSAAAIAAAIDSLDEEQRIEVYEHLNAMLQRKLAQ